MFIGPSTPEIYKDSAAFYNIGRGLDRSEPAMIIDVPKASTIDVLLNDQAFKGKLSKITCKVGKKLIEDPADVITHFKSNRDLRLTASYEGIAGKPLKVIVGRDSNNLLMPIQMILPADFAKAYSLTSTRYRAMASPEEF